MGDYEVASSTLSIFILTTLIYNLLTFLSFKDILRRFGFMKNTRRDFYECGFKPQTQKPIKVSIQFLIICVFFLLYDIELVFLFPFVSGYRVSVHGTAVPIMTPACRLGIYNGLYACMRYACRDMHGDMAG